MQNKINGKFKLASKVFLMMGIMILGTGRFGYSDSTDVREILGSFQELSELNASEFRKSKLSFIPKNTDVSLEDMAKDFSGAEDADLVDPFLQEGKFKLSIMDEHGAEFKRYTFLVNSDWVTKDTKDLMRRHKVKYHAVSSAEEDFEVTADIYMVKIKFSKPNEEKGKVCDYLKVVSLVVLKEVNFGNLAAPARIVGKFKSGNDDEFELSCE